MGLLTELFVERLTQTVMPGITHVRIPAHAINGLRVKTVDNKTATQTDWEDAEAENGTIFEIPDDTSGYFSWDNTPPLVISDRSHGNGRTRRAVAFVNGVIRGFASPKNSLTLPQQPNIPADIAVSYLGRKEERDPLLGE